MDNTRAMTNPLQTLQEQKQTARAMTNPLQTLEEQKQTLVPSSHLQQQHWASEHSTEVSRGNPIHDDSYNVMLQQFQLQQQQKQQQLLQQQTLMQKQSLAAASQLSPSISSINDVNTSDFLSLHLQQGNSSKNWSCHTQSTLSEQDAQFIAAQTNLIPSIVIPPSVLTSVLCADMNGDHEQQPRRRRKTAASSSDNSVTNKRGKALSRESPQHCIDRLLLQTRGFCTGQLRVKAEVAAYDTTPSPLQLASFGTELVRAIHTSDLTKMSQMLACGLSPNPCNQFRDSVLDLVCKRANASVLHTLVQHGCELRVCDGFGRTPLHHCCWASTFCPEIANTILQHDWRQLFLEDKRGQTALEYIREDLYEEWNVFLEQSIPTLVPEHVEPMSSMRQSRPDGVLIDPVNALPPKLAAALSSGKLTPEQVRQMSNEVRAKFEC
jgi:hypothetical protein